MSRKARFVVPGIPHHITQRGNRRNNLFFTDNDRKQFLFWLEEAARKSSTSILAYCLMTNHIHIAAVPEHKESLHLTLKAVFTKYAMRINRIHEWSGYVVQNRFYSSPLDNDHAMACVAYIENNPVRAKLVQTAEEYQWSSAYTRAKNILDPVIDYKNVWYRRLVGKSNFMPIPRLNDSMIAKFRICGSRNLPVGSDAFIANLETESGRVLRVRSRGRPENK